MSVTIWEPARYQSGFQTETVYGITVPSNGNTLAEPYDKDTKVAEVAHFEGWKESFFRDCGEFELTTYDLDTADARKGYMVDFDGDFYVIENIRWEMTDEGYQCTISGRDFWKYAESMISQRTVGGYYSPGTADQLTGAQLGTYIALFFRNTQLRAGWFRDTRRFPWATITTAAANNLVRYDFADAAAFKASKAGAVFVSEIMSYGAEWRTFCQWFNCGLKFEVEFNATAGMFTIHPVLYEGNSNGVRINTSGRGISNFAYESNSQAHVNATYSRFESLWWIYPDQYQDYIPFMAPTTAATLKAEKVYSTLPGFADSATNYPERVLNWSEKYFNVSESPSDADSTSAQAVKDWIGNLASQQHEDDEVTFDFTYDNSGMFKYGTHFKLGDFVTIVDDFLGLSVSQRLTGVKTVYGADKRYEFEFGSQKIKQSDIIKRKLSEIDIRTY